LLTKGHETAIELSHVSTANVLLENEVLTQLNNVVAHINYLENQLQNLQQQNAQLAGEHNEFRITAMQQQTNLEIQITQLQFDK
jgi:protein subunit release factor B